MTTSSIQQQLSAISLWKVVTTTLSGNPHKVRTEITREFKFSSFEGAIAFMQEAVPHIKEANHHPRWENAYTTVKVWLSTWDEGYTISQRDSDLAMNLDGLFEHFRESHSELG